MNGRHAGRVLVVEFSRYFAASAIALVVDMGILLTAANFMHYLIAASLGFVVGATVSYFMATTWVFNRRQFPERRQMEFAVYAVVGLVGLGLNNITIFLSVDFFGLPLPSSKVFAAGITFLFNYIARKIALF